MSSQPSCIDMGSPPTRFDHFPLLPMGLYSIIKMCGCVVVIFYNTSSHVYVPEQLATNSPCLAQLPIVEYTLQ